jgi:hypothetical protein
MIEKICKKCCQMKPLSMYHANKTGGIKTQSWCKECSKEACRCRYRENEKFREKRKADQLKRYHSDEEFRRKNREYSSVYRKKNLAKQALSNKKATRWSLCCSGMQQGS